LEVELCIHCGDPVDADDCHRTDDGAVCRYCLEQHYSYCDRCETYVPDSTTEVHMVRGGTSEWCNDCLDSSAVRCEDCDDYFDFDTRGLVNDANADWHCPHCMEDRFLCPHCEFVYNLDGGSDTKNGYVCFVCQKEHGLEKPDEDE